MEEPKPFTVEFFIEKMRERVKVLGEDELYPYALGFIQFFAITHTGNAEECLQGIRNVLQALDMVVLDSNMRGSPAGDRAGQADQACN